MVRRDERGFALLMGLTVLVVLTVLGLSVMSSMGEDLVVVRNMRESENALAIAEAGLAWGLDKLNSDPSNQGYLFDDVKNYNQVLQDPNNYYFDLPGTASDDPLCTGLKDAQCDVWREITDKSNPELFGAAAAAAGSRGEFRVAYGDNDDGDGDYTQDDDDLILVRALGVDGAGSKRLIEIAVTVGN